MDVKIRSSIKLFVFYLVFKVNNKTNFFAAINKLQTTLTNFFLD